MNVSGLRSRVRNRTGTQDDDPSLPSNLVLDFLNEANQQIAAEHDWPWRQTSTTFPTVAGTASYAVPADYLRTRTLRVNANLPLSQRTMADLEQVYIDDNTRGMPRDYAIEGGFVNLRPFPDGIYTVAHRYLKLEPILTGDSSVPLMPEQFQTSIVEYATYLAFRRLGNSEQAAVAKTAFDTWLQQMQDKVRPARTPLQVLVRADSGWNQV